ncbi:hypothetical protein REPUB_Repub09cG0045200 [Reevesia pubescens]
MVTVIKETLKFGTNINFIIYQFDEVDLKETGTIIPAVDGRLCGVLCSKDQGSREKATAESVADAITDNRAELLHLPSTIDLNTPLPSKECPTCDGTISGEEEAVLSKLYKHHVLWNN